MLGIIPPGKQSYIQKRKPDAGVVRRRFVSSKGPAENAAVPTGRVFMAEKCAPPRKVGHEAVADGFPSPWDCRPSGHLGGRPAVVETSVFPVAGQRPDIRSGVETIHIGVAGSERHQQSGRSQSCFHELMLPHLDAAYNLARYLAREPDAADDIVQEAFLKGYRAFDGYRGGDARAWILAITRNCFFDWAKARKFDSDRTGARIKGTALDGEEGEGGAAIEFYDPDQETPEKAAISRDETQKVRKVIETLPTHFREALVLRELEELSYQEIAAITATPIGTVMSRLARARHMFAEAWRKRIENGEVK